MRSRITRGIGALMLVAAAACAGGDTTADSVMSDTMTIPGTDTVAVPTPVPTTDTLVTSKTITTDTNVIQGQATDTVTRP